MKKLISLFVICMLTISYLPVNWAAHSDYGCDGCHTPHNADPDPVVPLWNGSETTQTFEMYNSSTMDATADGQPTGTSKLCLSCHDGTLSWMDPDRQFSGDGLSRSHPISFTYDSTVAANDGALKDPSEPSSLGGTIKEDYLDINGKVQCSSCHDVHTSGVGENLLRGYDYTHGPDGGKLCRVCHEK